MTEDMKLDSDSGKEEGNESKPTDEATNEGGNTEETETMAVDEEEADGQKPSEGAAVDEAKSEADGDLAADDVNAEQPAAGEGEDPAEGPDRLVKVTLRLPAEGSGKLGMVLKDADGGRPAIVSLGPASPFHDVIPAHVLGDFVVVGIKGEGGDEVEIGSSADLQRELTARRKEGEEAAVEVSFERRERNGAEAGLEDEAEGEAIEPPKKKGKAEGETEGDSSNPAPTIKVTVRLPPAGSGKLGVVLKDDPLHRGLPTIAELKTESPFHGAIPPPLISHYCIVGIGDEENGEAAIGSSADLQRELAARRKEGGVVLAELSFERRSDESLAKERGEKKQAAENKKKEKGKDGVRRSARKKKADSAAEDPDRFARLYLQLPPEGAGKMGLIIQDDTKHRKLPIIMAVGPDSPFLNSIPPQVVGNYWVIAVKDEFEGLAKTRSSKELQRQLAARRRKGESTMVELSFAKKGVDGDVHQQYEAMQQAPVGQPPFALSGPAAQQQQMAMMTMQQTQMQQQLLLRQQMQQQLVAAATAPSESTHGRRTNERLENPLAPKGKLPKASAKDETVRKALSEYFSMGESRSVNEFCHAYAKQYSAISKELGDHPRLKEIRDRRKGDEEGFTEEDVREATDCLNEIYSRDYGKGLTPPEKRKRGETEKKMAKTQFPPLKPKEFCKGVQSKAVEDYYANKHCDNSYLHEHCRLSNFRGWRHKDCQFIGVLDKNQRCIKCRSAYSNLNMARTPLLFKAVSAVKTVEDSVLPKTHEIRQAVQNRMEALSGLEDVEKDPELLLVCKVMKLKNLVSVELDRAYFDLNRSMFIVCDHEDCLIPMLKKKRANFSTICDQCRKTKSNNERLKRRAETNKEDRVAVGSHVPFSRLTPDEAVERYNALSFQYKKLVQKCNKLEGKRADARQELFAAERRAKGAEFRAPLLPWPFYLNYNPVIAEEYSVPIPEVTAQPSPKKASGNRRGGSTRKAAAAKGGGRAGVAGSKDAPAEVEEKEEETAAEETAAEETAPEETAAEEIVDEPLDFASVGSAQEEGEGDGIVREGGDGATAGLDVAYEFDGQFV